MSQYHKIQTVFKRDPATNHKTLLFGEYSLPEFDYLRDNEWVFTEKVDGTNIRVMLDGGKVRFGGKSDKAQIPVFLLDRLVEMFPVEGFGCFDSDDGICLYGEGYGPKIQKGGGNYRTDPGFVLFDVRCGEWWLKREDVERVAADMGIDVVPVLGVGTLSDMLELVQGELISTWGDFQAEGIVARPLVELKTRSGKRIITKIKCRDFAQ